MWVLYARSHPALAGDYAAFVAKHRPLPYIGALMGAVLKVANPWLFDRFVLSEHRPCDH
jgi:hypothetical protein